MPFEWTFTLNSYVIGKQTGSLIVDVTDISGLFGNAVRSADVEYDTINGAFAGRDTKRGRLIGISWQINDETGDQSAVVTELLALTAAWAVPDPASDQTQQLEVTLPTGETWQFDGRSRDVTVRHSQLPLGIVTGDAMFFAPNPEPTIL